MGIFNNKKLFLFINSNNDEKLEYAIVNGKSIVEKGNCSIDDINEIKNKNSVQCVRVSLFSNLNYFEIADIKSHNKKFLSIASKKYVDNQFVFTEPYILKNKIIKSENGRFKVALSAIQKNDIDAVFSTINKINLPVDYITGYANSILSVSKYIINKNDLTLLWAKNGTEIEIKVVDGNIASREVREYENLESIDTGFSNNDILFLGDLSSKNSDTNLNRLKKAGYKDSDVLEYPELYGLFFMDKDFNFLYDDYKNEINSFKSSKYLLLASVVIFLIFLFLSIEKYVAFNRINKQFIDKKNALLLKQDKIKDKIPNKNEIDNLFKISKLENKFKQEPNVKAFLSWITNITPNSATIEYINIAHKNQKNNGQNDEYNDIQDEQNNTYANKFEAKIVVFIFGSYKITKQKAVDFIKKISQKVAPENSDFEYIKSENRAILKTTLQIDGGDF